MGHRTLKCIAALYSGDLIRGRGYTAIADQILNEVHFFERCKRTRMVVTFRINVPLAIHHSKTTLQFQ